MSEQKKTFSLWAAVAKTIQILFFMWLFSGFLMPYSTYGLLKFCALMGVTLYFYWVVLPRLDKRAEEEKRLKEEQERQRPSG